MKNTDVKIYTDGACSGNPGPGGWGAILECAGKSTELSGGENPTTNNRMELTAPIMALKKLKYPCNVTIISDSKYLCDAFNQHWIDNWQKNNWRKSDKQPVLNSELWKELINLVKKQLSCEFVWVKGHAGHPENERCDSLATARAAEFSDK